jgi:hypothetical protein
MRILGRSGGPGVMRKHRTASHRPSQGGVGGTFEEAVHDVALGVGELGCELEVRH